MMRNVSGCDAWSSQEFFFIIVLSHGVVSAVAQTFKDHIWTIHHVPYSSAQCPSHKRHVFRTSRLNRATNEKSE